MMESKLTTEQIRIGGMTCINCQNKIEKTLKNTVGIKAVKVSYNKGTAKIIHDDEKISLNDIIGVIHKLGYTVLKDDKAEISDNKYMLYLIIILVLYIILEHFGILNFLVPAALADTTMGYGMLFIIGVLTSVHCIAMCGGINLSQCLPIDNKKQSHAFMPAVLYNLGRVISYTVIGFLLGFIGMLLGGRSETGNSVILQGLIKLLAGCFMVIMGLNMLCLFPWLRRFSIRIPKFLAKKTGKKTKFNGQPFWVGLLNGFMPCGPLQSVQLVALASGNPFAGAFSMLLFSMGTVPLMLGLGTVISALGEKFTHSITKVGSFLVIVLGLAMLSQGGSLLGLLTTKDIIFLVIAFGVGCIVSELACLKNTRGAIRAFISVFAALVVIMLGHMYMPYFESNTGSESVAQVINDEQVIQSTLSPGRYPNITVHVGIPVKWIIDAPKGSINGCNNRMLIQEYGIEYSFKTGENIIIFTPSEIGQFQYSCWMGMIHGNITVIK